VADAPSVQVLPAERTKAEEALLQLQVTLRSPMGAVVYHTGGLLIDHGWLRVLGSGSDRMGRSLPGWNQGRAPVDANGRPTLVLVADDVLGGLFAVNGEALGEKQGEMFYLAPDTLQWESLSMGYTDFLAWALSPRLSEFYLDLRWPNWQDEVATLTGDQAVSVYPFVWATGPPLGQRSRKSIPVDELFRLMQGIQQQLSR
jgi:hypothetical protein